MRLASLTREAAEMPSKESAVCAGPCPCSDCRAVRQAIVEGITDLRRDFQEVAQRLGVGGAA